MGSEGMQKCWYCHPTRVLSAKKPRRLVIIDRT